MEIKSAFAIVLRRLRMSMGKSQEDFAFDVEIDRSYMSRLERGMAQPTLGMIFVLAKHLGLSASEFVRLIEVESKKTKKPLLKTRIRKSQK